jgi:hypothetical protein
MCTDVYTCTYLRCACMQKHGRFTLMSSRHHPVEKYSLHSRTLFEGTIFPSSKRHCYYRPHSSFHTIQYHTAIYIYIYRVFTKELCGFKNLLNDYILQLDGAPPIFTGMYESYWVMFSNSTGSDVLKMETTTYTYYMGRIRLSCGCVSCDPGCTHW